MNRLAHEIRTALVIALTALGCSPSVKPNQGDADPSVRLDGASDGPGQETVCSTSRFTPEPVPFDLYLLVDTSAGMLGRTESGAARWDETREALLSFVQDPGSAGIGVGLQYYPADGDLLFCTNDQGCSGAENSCKVSVKGCTGTVSGRSYKVCAQDKDCGGATCVPLGRCGPKSVDRCTDFGMPCPGNGQICEEFPKQCTEGEIISCDDTRYATPAVPMGDLPGSAAALVTSLEERLPFGTKPPMGMGVLGAVSYLNSRSSNRRTVIALATSNGNSGACLPDNVPDVAKVVAQAKAASPSILTFVIGFLSSNHPEVEMTAYNMLATAGGTKTPLIVDGTKNVRAHVLHALNEIRNTVPCEYSLSQKPGEVDFGRVNMYFTNAMGAIELVRAVPDQASCHATRGGWYYSPATGTPTHIVSCPASCDRMRGEGGAGRVDLQFGCPTEFIE